MARILGERDGRRLLHAAVPGRVQSGRWPVPRELRHDEHGHGGRTEYRGMAELDDRHDDCEPDGWRTGDEADRRRGRFQRSGYNADSHIAVAAAAAATAAAAAAGGRCTDVVQRR